MSNFELAGVAYVALCIASFVFLVWQFRRESRGEP
jgi:hypothetical protein